MNKISGLTIVNQQGTKNYTIGKKYNGLLLESITDNSVDCEVACYPMFYGKTKDNKMVFEAINVPMEIEYSERT